MNLGVRVGNGGEGRALGSVASLGVGAVLGLGVGPGIEVRLRECITHVGAFLSQVKMMGRV